MSLFNTIPQIEVCLEGATNALLMCCQAVQQPTHNIFARATLFLLLPWLCSYIAQENITYQYYINVYSVYTATWALYRKCIIIALPN